MRMIMKRPSETPSNDIISILKAGLLKFFKLMFLIWLNFSKTPSNNLISILKARLLEFSKIMFIICRISQSCRIILK